MFQEISYYLIAGIPFVVYLGIVSFIFLFSSATVAMLRRNGKTKLSVQWHFRFAYLALLFGIIHLPLGIFSYI